MREETKFNGGMLTIWTADGTEIIGELSDASWIEEQSEAGTNHVLVGTASVGTLDTVEALIQAGVASVTYEFAVANGTFSGEAMLLQPQASRAGATISFESPSAPTPDSADHPTAAPI